MNKELLEGILRLKLSLGNGVIEVLPEAIRGPVKDLEQLLMQALYDVAKEYANKEQPSENSEQSGGIKSIDVI